MPTSTPSAKVEQVTWYHCIDVGHGIVTPGRFNPRLALHWIELPADLSGRPVLDIGSYDGFFAFEAERRGATRVVATDWYEWSGPGGGSKRGFELGRRALSSQVQDVEIDVPCPKQMLRCSWPSSSRIACRVRAMEPRSDKAHPTVTLRSPAPPQGRVNLPRARGNNGRAHRRTVPKHALPMVALTDMLFTAGCGFGAPPMARSATRAQPNAHDHESRPSPTGTGWRDAVYVGGHAAVEYREVLTTWPVADHAPVRTLAAALLRGQRHGAGTCRSWRSDRTSASWSSTPNIPQLRRTHGDAAGLLTRQLTEHAREHVIRSDTVEAFRSISLVAFDKGFATGPELVRPFLHLEPASVPRVRTLGVCAATRGEQPLRPREAPRVRRAPQTAR